jgi:hypothetical protein
MLKKNPALKPFGRVDGSTVDSRRKSPYRLKGPEGQGLENLTTYIVPFYQNYVLPFSGKNSEFLVFHQILLLQRDKTHLTKEGLIEIVKLAYTLNEKGKGSTRKRPLETVLSIIETQFDTSLTSETTC